MKFFTIILICIFGGSFLLNASTKPIQLKPLKVNSKKTTTPNVNVWLVQHPVHKHMATVTIDLPVVDQEGKITPPRYYTLVLRVVSKEQLLFEVVLEGNRMIEINRVRFCADLSKQLLTNAQIEIFETLWYRANLKDFSILKMNGQAKP